MANLHVSLNALRSDAFTLEPETFTLVTDPDHPLYDPRVLDEPDEALVCNVMVYGVIEPVIIRKNGDKVEVVAGRGRVKAALEANRRLTAEGKQPIRVPAMLKRGQDADMFGVLISENECRREDNPLTKSEKAQRLINMGKSVEEVAVAFGVKRQSVEAWLALGDVAQPVLEAVESGEISATAASHLSKLDREEQVQTYEAMKAEGGKVTVERARAGFARRERGGLRGAQPPDPDGQAAREGDTAQRPKTKRMSWANIEYELQFIKDHPPEINVEFYKSMQNALQMVLGLGSFWPPRMPHKTDDTPEREARAEVYATLPEGTEIGWDILMLRLPNPPQNRCRNRIALHVNMASIAAPLTANPAASVKDFQAGRLPRLPAVKPASTAALSIRMIADPVRSARGKKVFPTGLPRIPASPVERLYDAPSRRSS